VDEDNIYLSEIIDADGDREPWLRPALMAPWGEIVVVIAVIIGISTSISSWQAWHGSTRNYMSDLLTNWRMIHTLTMESAILGLLFVHLHRRGWRAADLRIRPTWRSSGQGLLLLPGMALANSVTVVSGLLILYAMQTQYGRFFAFVVSNGSHMKFHSVHVSWLALIPALVLNGFFEEITCMGYAFNQFAAKRGPLFALVVTVLLRMSCHTYQGAVHALGIGAAFFVSGLVYWWTRNLWPLILAHIFVDLVSFAAVKFLFG
jgi:membrane protease YdiL (CAAX protease family)